MLLACVAGILGGAAAVALLSLGRPGAAEPAQTFSGLESLDRHVQELTAALRDRPVLPALPQQVDRSDEPRSPIEPLQPSTADLSPLLGRLDALIARLEVVSAGSVGAPFQFPDEAATVAARNELFATDPTNVIQAHRLMTYRQIAERYGRPDGIYIQENGSVSWRYERDDGMTLSFAFYDGLCK